MNRIVHKMAFLPIKKMMITRKRNHKNRQGATVVEFALVAPLVFMLLFGALELGHANMVFHSVEAAAYEGARKGILPGATSADCLNGATNLLSATGLRGASITVIPAILTDASTTVTVRVEVPYQANAITIPFFMRSLNITRECKLTRERAN